jgi:uncharacterized protein YoxC
MLTENDLQAIKTLIKDEVDPLRDGMDGVKSDVGGLKKDMNDLREDVGVLKKDMKVQKRQLNRVANDVHYISRKFDEEIVHTRRRVVGIEKHLRLGSSKN